MQSMTRSTIYTVLGGAMLWGGAVQAQETPVEDVVGPGVDAPSGEAVEAALEPEEDRLSGSVGVDWASHFMLYGLDVWGAGNDFYGGESTFFGWGELGWSVNDHLTLTAGVWGDINDNTESTLGGEVQEIDIYVGAATEFDRVALGATYQEWYYGGDTERIVDLSVAFDDSDLLFEGFSLNPAFLAHFRVDANGDQEEAGAYVFSIEPAFPLVKSADYPITLAVPMSVAIFGDDFYGGDSGFGYASVGTVLSMPLGFIPEEHGVWVASVGTTYYYTDEDAIPANPEDEFITGLVSLSLEF